MPPGRPPSGRRKPVPQGRFPVRARLPSQDHAKRPGASRVRHRAESPPRRFPAGTGPVRSEEIFMSRSSVVLLAFVFVCGTARSQEAGYPELAWCHTTDAAFKMAAEQKKPVLFCIHKDKEIACKRMMQGVYNDAAVQLKMK